MTAAGKRVALATRFRFLAVILMAAKRPEDLFYRSSVVTA
jgi:hypothetical protein